MKILSLTNEEFDFLNKIFSAAHDNMDELKKQMADHPLERIISIMEDNMSMVKDPELRAKIAEFKASSLRDRNEMYSMIMSLKVKFDHLTMSEQ